MKAEKFVTIDIQTESNIGILNLGDLTDIHRDDLKSFFARKVENRLIDALRQYFDCPVKVRLPADIKTFHPITIEYVVVIESMGGDYQEVVTLNETWIY